jgi:hypothetical protein
MTMLIVLASRLQSAAQLFDSLGLLPGRRLSYSIAQAAALAGHAGLASSN